MDTSATLCCAQIVTAAKKSHSELATAFETILARHGGDFAVVLLACVTENQASVISNVLRSVEALPSAANTLLQSTHALQFIEYLRSASGQTHIPAFLELLSNSHNNPHCYATLPREVFTALLALGIDAVALLDLGVSGHACMLVEELVKVSEESISDVVVASRSHEADATIYMRYLGVLSRIAAHSDAAFANCLRAGAVDLITGACRSTDVLVCIVALELLSVLATSRAGLDYLVVSGTFAWLVDLLTAPDVVLQQQALREVSLTLTLAAQNQLLDERFFLSLQDAKLLPRFLKCLHDQFEVVGTDTRITGTNNTHAVALTLLL